MKEADAESADATRAGAPGKLTIRLYEESDMPQLLRFWEAESGWGAITEEQWREWYMKTPYGDSLVVVGVDERGEIAAQEIFTPSRLVIDGTEVRALRLSAPILRKDFRRGALRRTDHPVIYLYARGMIAAIAQRYSVVYALPEHAWLPFFRWGPRSGLPYFEFVTAEYGCLERDLTPVDAVRTKGTNRFVARPAADFGDEYDELWRAAVEGSPAACGVRRDAARLRFRNDDRVITFAVRDEEDGSLAGYVSIKKRDGLITDFLARHPDHMSSVLTATIDRLARKEDDATGALKVIKVMDAPPLSAAARELNFEPTDYKFGFVCNVFDESLSKESIAAERWYVMPGD